MDILTANKSSLEATAEWCKQQLNALNTHDNRPLALIVDGSTLEFALTEGFVWYFVSHYLWITFLIYLILFLCVHKYVCTG